MKITRSKRMDLFPSSIFTELAEYKRKKIHEGYQLIDLSIGSPDLAPPDFLREELSQQTAIGTNYGYTLNGTDQFHSAVADYYKRKYNASLDAESEVLLSMGSQDALVHLPMVFCDPGDIILVPDPGYTAYATGISLAGATPYFMPLKRENAFLPDFSVIPEEIAARAKMMILNFPGNPIPVMAEREFFKKTVAFAKRFQIFIVHDFAYSELYFDHHKPVSFLSVAGSKDVAIELNSFSKSFNMAGCRIGYAAGNQSAIAALQNFKSNLDYGVFLPFQNAAIAAMNYGDEFSEVNRKTYEQRRNILVDGLRSLGWNVDSPQGGMFIWARIPEGFTSTMFAYELIDRAHVVVTPGNAFGPSGEGYVRIALVQEEAVLSKAVDNIRISGIFNLKTV
ncbi:LL-diaminopimelate aminotransferase [Bacillus sp. M6-12]|uniref:LL-diaminopimelate aminotransferase n=1 Tax=Bacillus sp. M6-12 TaxID=2054166 RepID=UPI000C785DAA|nr:LL-diaminopimelate aminotransferase [Bacillus sp. M6-12]PLS17134.1 LL-diaminopimelate aminotransferase [Bacillus sp. M6-12]